MAFTTITSNLLSRPTADPLSTTTPAATITTLIASDAQVCHLYGSPFTTLSAAHILATWLTFELLSLFLTIPVYALLLTSHNSLAPKPRTPTPLRPALLRCMLATASWALALTSFALCGCAISAAQFCTGAADAQAAWVGVVVYVQWGIGAGAVIAGSAVALAKLWVLYRRAVRREAKGKARVSEADVDVESQDFWGGPKSCLESIEMSELNDEVTTEKKGRDGIEKSAFQEEIDAIDKANEDLYAPSASGSGSNRSSASSSQQQALDLLEEMRIAAAKIKMEEWEAEAESRRGSRVEAGGNTCSAAGNSAEGTSAGEPVLGKNVG
ncbi:MAG: hypothetical protein M1830_006228 [Pleopsidium flavum]|nr:MAG: hypothetical protein M1830_006228 [Pleopsidium flavum]